MSPASLAVVRRPQLDPARIAAISVALALNVALLLIASMPVTSTITTARHAVTAQLVRLIEPPPPVPPPPPVKLEPLPHPVAVPPVHALPKPSVMPPVMTPTDEGRVAMPPSAPPSTMPSALPANPTPIEASLAYRSAPLQFPMEALRERMHGTVLLRVLVDETGKPVEVQIERGSGHALLDRSAREQVLAHWRFQPAMVDGHAVRAWAQVPVSFELHSL